MCVERVQQSIMAFENVLKVFCISPSERTEVSHSYFTLKLALISYILVLALKKTLSLLPLNLCKYQKSGGCQRR